MWVVEKFIASQTKQQNRAFEKHKKTYYSRTFYTLFGIHFSQKCPCRGSA